MGWTSNLKLVSQIGEWCEWQLSIRLDRCSFHLSASITSTTTCRSWLGFEGNCSGLEYWSFQGIQGILAFLYQCWDQPELTSMFGTMMLVSHSITGPRHFWNYQWTSMDRVWYVGRIRSFKLARLTCQTCLRALPLLWPRCARYLSDFCQYSRFDLSWTSCSDPMYISNP